MTTTPAVSLRTATFGKRPATVINTAPKPGLLDRLGLASSIRISLLAMVAILATNWWLG